MYKQWRNRLPDTVQSGLKRTAALLQMESKELCRPLGHGESLLYDFVDVEGGFTVVESLTLSTKSELSDSVVVKSLESWARIFPMLRMRVEEKDGVRYFLEIENMTVDFERVDGGDWMKAYNDLLNKTFNEAGPLWRVWLVDQGQVEGELKPYKYVMLLNWHHAITDGTTNVRMCNRLAEVINSALGNETVEYGQEVEVKPPMEELLPQREYTWNEIKPLLMETMQVFSNKEGTLWGQVLPGENNHHSVGS